MIVATPLGPMAARFRGGVLVALGWDLEADGTEAPELAARLGDYFAGDRSALDSFPAAPIGTPFQQRVWAWLRTIPAGETRSYLDGAIALGDRNLTRAVGAANGANPVALVVPCHRVVGATGQLTGYAAGIERKQWLLTHERGGQLGLFGGARG